MLNDVKIQSNNYIIIESDNCSSQYKSCNHFENMQWLSNKFGVAVLRVFGVAKHGKGEVDHVGGLAKTTIRQKIGTGEHFQNAATMVEYFQDKSNLVYKVREVNISELDEARFEASKKGFITINGSSLFQVIVFTPHSHTIKAAPRLCLCDSCKTEKAPAPFLKHMNLVYK